MSKPADWCEVTPVADLLVRGATRHPERDAIVFPEFRLTYRELLERATVVARGLIALGVRPRDHVGLLAPNGIEFLEGFFGASMIGAVVVPLNARHKASELGYIVENADLTTILTVAEEGQYVDFATLLHESLPSLAGAAQDETVHLPEAPKLRSAILLKGEMREGFISRTAFDHAAQSVTANEANMRRRRVRVLDTAVMLYTSGTTANPKGCVLSHEALTRGPVERATQRFITDGPHVSWAAGPMFHIGSMAPMIGAIGAGGTYLNDVYFDAGRAIALLEREKPTTAWPWFAGPMQLMLNHPDFDATQLESIRYMLLIGPPVLIDRVQELFPKTELVAACGMTETGGIYALSDRDETNLERSTAQGKAAPGVEVKIVDPATGEEQPVDEPGEILVRGYCVTDGYYKVPEATAAAIDADNWLHTGDLYSRTATGGLRFCGRIKDMLKVGGENVAALEIESFLCEHPSVLMAAVIGKPDETLDEVPVAFVELREGHSLTTSALLDFCTGRISRYKVPREVHFIDGAQWPMSATKINKRGLRKIMDSVVGSGS